MGAERALGAGGGGLRRGWHGTAAVILAIAAINWGCGDHGGGAVARPAAPTPVEKWSGTFPSSVVCAGYYPRHLQGIAVDDRGSIYWSFTDELVKTDMSGAVTVAKNVESHHGDLCYLDGELTVAVNLGVDSSYAGADSWVYRYSADDLAFLERRRIPELTFGAGGIAYGGRRFVVVGGLPQDEPDNAVFEYDNGMDFVRKVAVAGNTILGIQVAAFGQGNWWFACYGGVLFRADATLTSFTRFRFDASLGLAYLGDNLYYVASGPCDEGVRCTGVVRLARADASVGLSYVTDDTFVSPEPVAVQMLHVWSGGQDGSQNK